MNGPLKKEFPQMEKWQSPTTSGADRVIGDKLDLRSTDITNNETSPKLKDWTAFPRIFPLTLWQ